MRVEWDEYPVGSLSVNTTKRLSADVNALTSMGRVTPDFLDGNVGKSSGQTSHRNFVEYDDLHPSRLTKPACRKKGSHSSRRQLSALTLFPPTVVPSKVPTR